MKKLVIENLNELRNFEHKKDPLSSLGVGKIHLIRSWLDEMGVENYTINDDFIIDVCGNVYLGDKDIKELPEFIQYRYVNGTFDCDNTLFTSLRGCPEKILDSFYCSYNNLSSLEYCPNFVGAEFGCHNNLVTFDKDYIMSLCKVDEHRIYN